jgi:hypothetical protein
LADGTRRQSNWRVIGLGLAGLAVFFFVAVFVVGFLLPHK